MAQVLFIDSQSTKITLLNASNTILLLLSIFRTSRKEKFSDSVKENVLLVSDYSNMLGKEYFVDIQNSICRVTYWVFYSRWMFISV